MYYFILKPLSWLPSWMLYRISDVMYILLYRLVGYRKKVVRTNIQNSFPELTKAKQIEIERKFYVHLCDLIIESIMAFSISKRELEERFVYRNPEIFKKYFDNNQHVTLIGGHYGNWELFAVSVGLQSQHQPIALFTPLSNKFMNHKMTKSRSKFGLWMKSYAEVKEIMKTESARPFIFCFVSDQCPHAAQQPYWTEFLNQETGVQFGAEKFSRDNKTPVIYGYIHKPKRGYYEVEYKLICEDPAELEMGMISEKHTRMLEEDIRNEPAYWLWTHKRWKRTKKDFIKMETAEFASSAA